MTAADGQLVALYLHGIFRMEQVESGPPCPRQINGSPVHEER